MWNKLQWLVMLLASLGKALLLILVKVVIFSRLTFDPSLRFLVFYENGFALLRMCCAIVP